MALTMHLLESSMDQLFKELAHSLIRRPSPRVIVFRAAFQTRSQRGNETLGQPQDLHNNF